MSIYVYSVFMNILHLVDAFTLGGTEKTMQIGVQAIAKDSAITVHAGAWIASGPREAMLREFTPHVVVFNESADALVAYITEHDIDLVHVHRSDVSSTVVLDILSTRTDVRIVETNVFGKITNRAVESAVDMRLLVSQFCAVRLQQQLGTSHDAFSAKHRVVYNPLPLEYPFTITAQEQAAFRTRIGVDVDTPLLGRVGRADDKKFGPMVLRMLPRVIVQHPNVRLVLQSASSRVQRYIARTGLDAHVIVLPETSDERALATLYASVDMVTHASLIGESFGCTIAEAMAMGAPVVVNSTPYADNAQVELVDNGITGYVVDNAHSYAAAVNALLNDASVRKQFGDAGSQKAKGFAGDRIAAMWIEVYNSILSGTPLEPQGDWSAHYAQRLHNIYTPQPVFAAMDAARDRIHKKLVNLR